MAFAVGTIYWSLFRKGHAYFVFPATVARNANQVI